MATARRPSGAGPTTSKPFSAREDETADVRAGWSSAIRQRGSFISCTSTSAESDKNASGSRGDQGAHAPLERVEVVEALDDVVGRAAPERLDRGLLGAQAR